MIDTNIIEKEYDKRQSVQLRGGGGLGGEGGQRVARGGLGVWTARICLAIIKEGETRLMGRKEGIVSILLIETPGRFST